MSYLNIAMADILKILKSAKFFTPAELSNRPADISPEAFEREQQEAAEDLRRYNQTFVVAEEKFLQKFQTPDEQPKEIKRVLDGFPADPTNKIIRRVAIEKWWNVEENASAATLE